MLNVGRRMRASSKLPMLINAFGDSGANTSKVKPTTKYMSGGKNAKILDAENRIIRSLKRVSTNVKTNAREEARMNLVKYNDLYWMRSP